MYGSRSRSCSFSLSYASYYNIPAQMRVSVDHFLPIFRVRIRKFMGLLDPDPDDYMYGSRSRSCSFSLSYAS
jgi:hypothetical protein